MAGQESHAHSSDQTSDHRRFNKGNGLPGLDAADGLVVVNRLLREAVLVAL